MRPVVYLLFLSFGFYAQNGFAFSRCPVGESISWNQSNDLAFSVSSNGKSQTCTVLNPEIFANQRILGCKGTDYSQLTVRIPAGLKHNCLKITSQVMTVNAVNVSGIDEKYNRALPLNNSLALVRTLPTNPVRQDASSQVAASPSDASSVIASDTKPSRKLTPEMIAASEAESDRLAGVQIAENEGRALDSLMENITYDGQGVKKFANADLYAKCLLDKTEDGDTFSYYSKQYAADINSASSSFGTPSFFLKCTCAQESRFVSSAAERKKRFGSEAAAGVCQATGTFIQDLNESLKGCIRDGKNNLKCGVTGNYKELQKSWDEFLAKAHKSAKCKKALAAAKPYTISKQLLDDCPALSIGTASLGTKILVNRLKSYYPKAEQENFEKTLIENPLDAYAAIAGSYTTGSIPGLLQGVGKNKRWINALTAKACTPRNKSAQANAEAQVEYDKVRNHIIKIRNCMQEGVYLNPDGSSMESSCLKPAGIDPKKRLEAEADARSFAASVPENCRSSDIHTGTSSTESAVDGE